MIRPEHKFVAIPPTVKIFFAVLFSGAGRRGRGGDVCGCSQTPNDCRLHEMAPPHALVQVLTCMHQSSWHSGSCCNGLSSMTFLVVEIGRLPTSVVRLHDWADGYGNS